MSTISISLRSRGPDVRRWQLFLRGQGLLDQTADGIFDAGTDFATRRFQELNAQKRG